MRYNSMVSVLGLVKFTIYAVLYKYRVWMMNFGSMNMKVLTKQKHNSCV